MRLEVDRAVLRIVPETPQDEAYLEHVLGLAHGQRCLVRRVQGDGGRDWGCAEVRRMDEEAGKKGCGQLY